MHSFYVNKSWRIFDQMRTAISKEEIQEMPVGKFEGKTSIIDEVAMIDLAIESIRKETIIGIDTETKPSFKKGVSHNTSLVQIACSTEVFLFRLNKIGFPDGLKTIFEDKAIQKIGIAIAQDLKEIKQQFSTFTPQEFVDLNVLCKKMGFENIGAKNLSAMVLGFSISKRQQTSNWENPELSPAQISYAATDAWICREIYLKLMKL